MVDSRRPLYVRNLKYSVNILLVYAEGISSFLNYELEFTMPAGVHQLTGCFPTDRGWSYVQYVRFVHNTQSSLWSN